MGSNVVTASNAVPSEESLGNAQADFQGLHRRVMQRLAERRVAMRERQERRQRERREARRRLAETMSLDAATLMARAGEQDGLIATPRPPATAPRTQSMLRRRNYSDEAAADAEAAARMQRAALSEAASPAADDALSHRLQDAVGEAFTLAHAEGSRVAQELLEGRGGSTRAGLAAGITRTIEALDELACTAARHELLHAAVVLACRDGGASHELEPLVRTLARSLAPQVLLVFRPLLLAIAKGYLDWLTQGASRPCPRAFDLRIGCVRYLIGFHSTSGPAVGSHPAGDVSSTSPVAAQRDSTGGGARSASPRRAAYAPSLRPQGSELQLGEGTSPLPSSRGPRRPPLCDAPATRHYFVGLRQPPPRLAWMATTLLGAIDAFAIRLGIVSECTQVLQSLVYHESSARPSSVFSSGGTTLVQDAAVVAPCERGDEVLLQHATFLESLPAGSVPSLSDDVVARAQALRQSDILRRTEVEHQEALARWRARDAMVRMGARLR